MAQNKHTARLLSMDGDEATGEVSDQRSVTSTVPFERMKNGRGGCADDGTASGS